MSKKYAVIVILLAFLFAGSANAQQWRPVSGSRQANISGMALIENERQHSAFLIVHDNKKKEQLHVAILTVDGRDSPKYTPLKWLGDDSPTDLEAVSTVPDLSGQFVAFTAAGRVYHIKLDLAKNSVEVIKSFDVPMIPKDVDFEGFALQKINNILIAVWADRGLSAKPATLFWSKFDIENHTFSQVGSTSFKVPYPTNGVRHIADLKVDTTGAVFIVSASDPGNDGPFSSAAYFAGVFRVDVQKKVIFAQPAVLTPIFRFEYHKVEAFDFVPGADGGMIFGTDDENFGASILLTF